jgi:hypothetical protein
VTDRPALVALAFVTLAGTEQALILCREHKQSVREALSTLGLPRGVETPLPADARAVNGRRLLCVNCSRRGANLSRWDTAGARR